MQLTGTTLSIKVEVSGPQTLVPAKLVIATATTHDVLNSRAIVVGPGGWVGTYDVPINSPDSHFVVQCTELFSGMVGTTTTSVLATDAAVAAAASTNGAVGGRSGDRVSTETQQDDVGGTGGAGDVATVGTGGDMTQSGVHSQSHLRSRSSLAPLPLVDVADTKFGLHIKAVAVSGGSVLVTAMHVGDNAVCVDASTGSVCLFVFISSVILRHFHLSTGPPIDKF
jgi:hypothetical protein